MGPASCHQIFISLYLKAFIQNLVQIGTIVPEKIQFDFLNVHDLRSRSRNDIDLQYSNIFDDDDDCFKVAQASRHSGYFIYSIRCLLLLSFRSLAAIVSKKSLFSLFPIEKPKLPNLTLP